MAFAVPDSKFDIMNETMACETALVHTRSKVLDMFKVDRLVCNLISTLTSRMG